MFVASGEAIVPTRIIENFLGKPIKEATFSSPVRLVGFISMPEVGNTFQTFKTKKEAEEYVQKFKEEKLSNKSTSENVVFEGKQIPLIIKTDVLGTIEAIEKEIGKINTPEIAYKIVSAGVGAVNESDLKMASVNKDTIIVGFGVKIDNGARDMNETLKVDVEIFDIIYKLIEKLETVLVERKPKQEVVEVTGTLKVLRTFSSTKDKQVLGGKVITGRITDNGAVRIMRRDFEIGRGKITSLQQGKIRAREVLEDTDCGISVESKIDIASGDTLEAFVMVVK
jgi:translation initiation factor IF-2